MCFLTFNVLFRFVCRTLLFRGLLFARKWHRAEDRVDYILGELDMLLDERRIS